MKAARFARRRTGPSGKRRHDAPSGAGVVRRPGTAYCVAPVAEAPPCTPADASPSAVSPAFVFAEPA